MAIDLASNIGNWVSIGTYTLDGSSRVETHNGYNPSPSGNRAIGDAVRFVPTGGSGSGGSASLNPTADRDTQGTGSGTASIVHASLWNTILLKFDLSSVGTPVAEAVLRLYRPSDSDPAVVSTHAATTDSWTETGTSASYTGPVLDSTTSSGSGTWVELDVTSLVDAEAAGDGIVSIAVRTDLSSWVAFSSREGSHPPELNVSW